MMTMDQVAEKFFSRLGEGHETNLDQVKMFIKEFCKFYAEGGEPGHAITSYRRTLETLYEAKTKSELEEGWE